MDAPCRIREATRSDLDAVAVLERAVFSDPWEASAFAPHLGPYFLVAEVNDALVGYVLGSRAADQAEVLNLAVASAHQRRGIATRLWGTLSGLLVRAGVRDVFLEVRESNRSALDFYDVLGFRTVGSRPRYYRHPPEDALVLRCCICASIEGAP
jgi:ribosomal-protein-alanine N-acetyltransferase